MKEKDFQKLVKIALKSLPEKIFREMENVAIVVEKGPNKEKLKKAGIRSGGLLLGLYQGVPKTI